MLKGTKSEVIEQVYNEQLRLSRGAEEMINFFKAINVKTAVISGGLAYFAKRIQGRLGLDNYRANNVEITDDCLTGNVTGKVIDAAEKARYIHELCTQYGFQENQVIAIGDGANDLEMMKIAGLSVAYHAKPLLQENCDVVIKYGGLDTMIDFFDKITFV
jgi:phosphoserine phosphatase